MKLGVKIIYIVIFISAVFAIYLNWGRIQEINRFGAYKSALRKLPSNNINSAIKAQSILLDYLQATDNQLLRDKAFETYRVTFFKIMRNTRLTYKGVIIDDCEYNPEGKLPEIELYFDKKGFRLLNSEGCLYIDEDNNFTIKMFSKFLSPPWREYLELRKSENNHFLSDGTLIIPWDELRVRIIFWEKFINKYPDFPENNEIKAKLADYVQWYIEAIYGYGDNGILKPELVSSYEKFLKYNKDSQFYPLINDWYFVLKKNKFIYRNYFEEDDEVKNDTVYKKFNIKQPYKVNSYNKDVYDSMSP